MKACWSSKDVKMDEREKCKEGKDEITMQIDFAFL